jgi:hypothetical protein
MDSVRNWLDWLAKRNTQLDDKDKFAASVDRLRQTLEQARPNVVEFRDATDRNREYSDQLDLAGGQLVVALNLVVKTMVDTESFCVDVTHRLTGESIAK